MAAKTDTNIEELVKSVSCPLSDKIFSCPILASDGEVYECDLLWEHIKKGDYTSPTHKDVILTNDFTILKQLIDIRDVVLKHLPHLKSRIYDEKPGLNFLENRDLFLQHLEDGEVFKLKDFKNVFINSLPEDKAVRLVELSTIYGVEF